MEQFDRVSEYVQFVGGNEFVECAFCVSADEFGITDAVDGGVGTDKSGQADADQILIGGSHIGDRGGDPVKPVQSHAGCEPVEFVSESIVDAQRGLLSGGNVHGSGIDVYGVGSPNPGTNPKWIRRNPESDSDPAYSDSGGADSGGGVAPVDFGKFCGPSDEFDPNFHLPVHTLCIRSGGGDSPVVGVPDRDPSGLLEV